MAKTIKRWGATPVWGLEEVETTTAGQMLLATSIDWTPTMKDYEQTNHLGQVQGYLIYDGQVDWSMTANIIHEKRSAFLDHYVPASEIVLSNTLGKDLLESDAGLGYDPDDAVSICKQASVSQTSDGAASLNLSGTVYYFGGEDESN